MNHCQLLIIDDDPISRIITEKVLLRIRFKGKVRNFASGSQAIDYLATRYADPTLHPITDIVLLDWLMPLMDGFEFLEQLVQIPGFDSQRVKVIMLSGLTHLPVKITLQTPALLVDFLTKPLTPEKMKETLAKINVLSTL